MMCSTICRLGECVTEDISMNMNMKIRRSFLLRSILSLQGRNSCSIWRKQLHMEFNVVLGDKQMYLHGLATTQNIPYIIGKIVINYNVESCLHKNNKNNKTSSLSCIRIYVAPDLPTLTLYSITYHKEQK